MSKEYPDFPSKSALKQAVIDALKALGGQATTREINDKVIEILQLPDSVVQLENPDGLCTMLDYQLRWARTDLKDQIENVSRGIWKLK